MRSLKKLGFSVFEILKEQKRLFITAESLTAGLISSEFTKIEGSSQVFWGGFSVYSPEAKMRLLSVPAETIERYGVVSVRTAEAMAKGALAVFFAFDAKKGVNSPCKGAKTTETVSRAEPGFFLKDIDACAIAVTGLAGPGGSTENCPLGTVCFGFAYTRFGDTECISERCLFSGSREKVRKQTVEKAFSIILKTLSAL